MQEKITVNLLNEIKAEEEASGQKTDIPQTLLNLFDGLLQNYDGLTADQNAKLAKIRATTAITLKDF